MELQRVWQDWATEQQQSNKQLTANTSLKFSLYRPRGLGSFEADNQEISQDPVFQNSRVQFTYLVNLSCFHTSRIKALHASPKYLNSLNRKLRSGHPLGNWNAVLPQAPANLHRAPHRCTRPLRQRRVSVTAPPAAHSGFSHADFVARPWSTH